MILELAPHPLLRRRHEPDLDLARFEGGPR